MVTDTEEAHLFSEFIVMYRTIHVVVSNVPCVVSQTLQDTPRIKISGATCTLRRLPKGGLHLVSIQKRDSCLTSKLDS